MENTYIEQQIINMLASIRLFESACNMAAKKDDGTRSKEEDKALKKISVAGDRYKKELKNLLK